MTASIADFDLACAATALFLYPVKACAGMALDSLNLDARGAPVGDRAGRSSMRGRGHLAGRASAPALGAPAVTGSGPAPGPPGVADIAVPADAADPCRVKIWNDAHRPP